MSERAPLDPRGRFNQDRAETLLNMIRGGNTLKVACGFAGIDYTTLRRWVLKADDPTAPQEYVDFKAELEKARAQAQVVAVAQIRKAASDGSWQAAAWFLERSFPEDWGRRDTNRVELVGDGGGPVRVVAGMELDAESMTALAQRLAGVIVKRDEDVADAEVLEDPRALAAAPVEREGAAWWGGADPKEQEGQDHED